MSKFVKGTSILGVVALGLGVWQITEIDQEQGAEVEAFVKQEQQSYETVIIDQQEQKENPLKNNQWVDTRTLRSIQESIHKNDEMKKLIKNLGRGVEADLEQHQVDTDEEWKALEEDTKDKKAMIRKLLKSTNHEGLENLASKALEKFEHTIQSREFTSYKEAVDSFKALSDQL